MTNQKKISAAFFQYDNGKQPVRDWISGLDKEKRKLIGEDVATCEFMWPVGPPTCQPLGDGLFEVRTNLPDKTISRVFFCVDEGLMILLHGIIKKSQKTPKQDLELARSRKKMAIIDLKRRGGNA